MAAAAREKLAQASKEWKEKQLQAERKRKAALFLQALRGPETELNHADMPFVPAEVCLHIVHCNSTTSERRFKTWWNV